MLAGFWKEKGTFLRIPFGLSTLTSEMSGLLPSALRPSPHSLHPSPASSPSPPGSYRLAPNQLDAATLGSAALARERHRRPWHCGKPKAAEHAHDRHLAAGRGARTGVPGTRWSPAGGQHKDVLHSGAESEPSRQPRLRLPPKEPHCLLPPPPPREGLRWCHYPYLSRIQGKLEHGGTRACSGATAEAPGWWTSLLSGEQGQKEKMLRGQNEILERGQPALLSQRWCQKRLEGKDKKEGGALRPCCWIMRWLVPVWISFCPLCVID